MADEIREVLATARQYLLDSEWQTRNAAENRYCPYCAGNDYDWTDQDKHKPDCSFVTLIARIDGLLQTSDHKEPRP